MGIHRFRGTGGGGLLSLMPAIEVVLGDITTQERGSLLGGQLRALAAGVLTGRPPFSRGHCLAGLWLGVRCRRSAHHTARLNLPQPEPGPVVIQRDPSSSATSSICRIGQLGVTFMIGSWSGPRKLITWGK